MKPWKLLKSQIVFDNFAKIEERTYKMPNGQIANFYIKIVKPTVCAFALTEDNKVIAVEQFRPGPNKILFELPGGFMDEGEVPEQAMARELLEETGYAGDLEFITLCYDDAYTTIRRSCFVATNCKKVGTQQLDDSEFLNLKLIDLSDYLKIIRKGQTTDVEVAYLALDHLGLLESKI